MHRPLEAELEDTCNGFVELYRAVPVEGEPIPTHISPVPKIDDEPASEEEILGALKHLRRNRAPGPSGIRPEDLLES